MSSRQDVRAFKRAYQDKERECLQLRDHIKALQRDMAAREEWYAKDIKKMNGYLRKTHAFVLSIRLKLTPYEKELYKEISATFIGDKL